MREFKIGDRIQLDVDEGNGLPLATYIIAAIPEEDYCTLEVSSSFGWEGRADRNLDPKKSYWNVEVDKISPTSKLLNNIKG